MSRVLRRSDLLNAIRQDRSIALAGLAGATILFSTVAQWHLIAVAGPGFETDGFFAALSVPQFLTAVVVAPLNLALIPSFVYLKDESNTFGLLAPFWTILIAICAALGSTANVWVQLVAPGLPAETTLLTVRLAQIHLGSACLAGIAATLQSRHYADDRSLRVAVSSAVGSLFGLVIQLPLMDWLGIEGAAWALSTRATVEICLLASGIHLAPSIRLSVDFARDVWRRAKAPIVSGAIVRSDLLADRAISSLGHAGSISALYIGQQVYGAIAQIINKSMTTPMLATMSSSSAVGNEQAFHQQSQSLFRSVARLNIWIVSALVIAASSALVLKNYWGGPSADAVGLFATTALALCFVLPGDTLANVLVNSFYASGDTSTPSRIAIVSVLVGFCLKAAMYLTFGFIGLATAVSLQYLLKVGLLWYWHPISGQQVA